MKTSNKRKYREILEKAGDRFRPFLSGRRPWLIAIGAALVIAAFFVFRPEKKTEEYIIVKKMDLIRDVSVTGKVKASESVNLAFERSGRVAKILSPGAKVRPGAVLSSLDNSDYAASLKEARGTLESREAELSELLSGAKPEDVSVTETEVLSARESLSAAGRELVAALEDGEGVLSDVLNIKISGLFTKYQSGNKLNIALTNNLALQSRIELAKDEADKSVADWSAAPYSSYAEGDLISFAEKSVSSAEKTRVLLDDIGTALSGQYTGSINVDSWKTVVSSSRTSVSASLDKLRTAKDKYVSDKNSLSVKIKQLDFKKSPASSSEIAAKVAQVKSAEGRVETVIAEMEKGIIRSPFSGVVAKTDIEAGETAVAGNPVVSVISDNLFMIEANIAENDIAKVGVGNTAVVTLDAYGSDVAFDARIVSIDPGETVLEGVATYRAVFEFLLRDDRVKSGMTANIDIRSGEKKGALALPQRSVIARNGGKFVIVSRGEGRTEEVEVETGFRSSDGYVEIISGLAEGDKVISPSSNKK